MTATSGVEKVRNAERTREAILDSAEGLFASRGFDAASLAEIGVIAGVSRGTPSYFFGSKEDLYVAVLERMYEARNIALGPVFRPLVEWAQAAEASRPLRSVLAKCVEGYLRFLHSRPTYVDIIEREALAGGNRLVGLANQTTIMEDAFAALRRRRQARGLKNFDPREAVMLLVSLGFLPVAHRETMLRRQGERLDDPQFVKRREKHIVDMLHHLLSD